MASFLARQTLAQDENARIAGGKPAAVADSRPVARRAFGDSASTNIAATGKPVVVARQVSGISGGVPAVAAAAPQFAAYEAAPAYQAPELPEFDKADANAPEAVTDYVGSIYQYFRNVEVLKHAKPGYLAHQTDINEKMRAILIDWLVEVHLKFKLMPETMYLTVNLIDRYLELKPVQRTKLQLVGVTAMLLASKYEEIYAPEVRDFVYITDKAYTKEQILQMEANMLNTLGFRITVPTSFVFLNRFLKVAEQEKVDGSRLLATFFLERTLQEYSFLRFPASKIAAASVNMMMRTRLGRSAWDARMVQHTGYTQEDLRDCIEGIQMLINNQPNSNLKAVFKKYSNTKFGEVAASPYAPLDA